MRLTGHYRKMDLLGDITKPSGIENPCGGVTSKVFHLREALPEIEIYDDLSNPGAIVLVEALWFDEMGDDEMQRRIERYASLDSLKILWTSDTSCLRWKGHHRAQIFDASDIVGCLSEYSHQLLQFHTPKAEKLYDPLNIDMFSPRRKTSSVFSIGQISIEKNIEGITAIFEAIPNESKLRKLHIGSKNLWGLNHYQEQSDRLEYRLSERAKIVSGLPRTKIATLMGTLWGYVADTYYDFSSYSMMEAMLCGCWAFTGKHLMYDERPGKRFSTTEEAVAVILQQLKETPPESGVWNEEGRQFIIDRNSYDVFRRQLKDLIGDYFGL